MTPRLGIAALVVIATLFGANHVAARVAIDHGASVAGAVAVRSACTGLFLLLLLRGGIALPRPMLPRALATGVLVAVQSFCLYSAVSRIPVALALLVFQSFPLLYVLLSWASGKERPRLYVLAPIGLALVGLAMALDVHGKAGAARWEEIREGVLWAFGASVTFTLTAFSNAHWLKGIDARLRTFYMMAVTAALTLAGGAAAGALALPQGPTGWIALVLLTVLYGTAITSFFLVLPKLGGAVGTVALNFEPIAALAIAWVVLGQSFTPLQTAGALLVVGAIGWLSLRR